jgi:hypothetical protein
MLVAALAASLVLAPVGSFDAPVYVTAPPGDAHRIFVVEKTGRIQVVKDGQKLGTPFLSLAGHVSGDSEQGLLSMAFAPDYATSGAFYVDYTDNAGNTQVVEYHASANPDVADPASARTILSQDQPEPNHNGGQLQFGPDGDLYIGLGDGGGGGDQHGTIGNGQDLGTWLGKILRIDPHPSAGKPYTVPSGNPFAGRAGALPEIWAYGLRNPWRFSFDSATGDLWIGDVGQDSYEEIDHAARGVGGQNYGWRVCEGTHSYPAGGDCTATGLTGPVLDYHHDSGRCSVTGGYLVRDAALTDLAGAYVYGDYCTGEMWAVRPPAPPQLLSTKLPGLSSFGEDSCGHLYAASSQSGAVVRFTQASTVPCPTAGPCGCGGGGGGGGGGARSVSLRAGRVSHSGRAALRVGCSAGFTGRCRVTLTVRRGRSRAAATRRFSVVPGHTRTVHTRLTRAARRSLARHRRLVVRGTAVGRDATASARRSARLTLRAPRRARARAGR